MFVRTGDVAATITLPEGKEFVMPGENANLTFELMWDMPLEVGLKFTLREGSRTVGTAVVTKLGDRVKVYDLLRNFTSELIFRQSIF